MTDFTVLSLRRQDFYLREPRTPLTDPWAWVLVTFPVISAAGFAVFSFFGFGYTALWFVPEVVKAVLVLLGAIALGFGGEFGSIFAGIEVARKYGNGTVTTGDKVGIVVSALATIAINVTALAWLSKLETLWGADVQLYGPLAFVVLAVIDATFAGAEAGLYLAQYEKRYQVWERKFEKWQGKQEGRLDVAEERRLEQVDKTEKRKLEQEMAYASQGGLSPHAEARVFPGISDVIYAGCCWCGAMAPIVDTDTWHEQHYCNVHYNEAWCCGVTDAVAAHAQLVAKYDGGVEGALWNFPTVGEVAQWKETLTNQ